MALQREVSISEIAKELGFNKSTIYREIRRNKDQEYDPMSADLKAQERFQRCRRSHKISGTLEDIIQYYLFDGWSPDQITGRLEQEGYGISVSRQTIYNFIYDVREDLEPLLRRYAKRGAGRFLQRKNVEKFKLHISLRSPVINKRLRVGDFERDCMRFSKTKQEVLVCTDRKSRYTKLCLSQTMSPKIMTSITKALLKEHKLESITNDNGLEFRDSHSMGVPVYFCDPGRPQQRGTIENVIGRLRYRLPMGTNPSEVDLQAIEDQYNLTPRKCLNYKTPYEAYFSKKVALVV